MRLVHRFTIVRRRECPVMIVAAVIMYEIGMQLLCSLMEVGGELRLS